MGIETNLNSRLVSNTLVQFVTPAVRISVGLTLTAALTRHLGVEGFGQYALVFAYVAAFNGILNDAGLGTILLREISQHPEERGSLLFSGAALQLVVALATYGLMLASLIPLQYPFAVKLSISLYGLVILFSPLDLLALPFQADLRLTRLLAPSLIGVLLSFVLTMVIIRLNGSLEAIIGAALAGLATQYVWVTLISLRAIGTSYRPLSSYWRAFLREAWPLWLATMATTALQQAPVLVLSTFSLEAVGLFNAANRIPQQLLLIPLAIRASTFPLLARSWSVDRATFRVMLDRLVRATLLISVPIAVLSVGLAEPLMRLLFGPAFTGAAAPFALLSCVLALLFPGIMVGEGLIAAGRQRTNLLILALSLPLLGVSLLWSTPDRGAVGAAGSLLVAYVFIVLASFLAGAIVVRGPDPLLALGPALIGAGLGAGVLFVGAPLGTPTAPVLAAIVATVAIAVLEPSILRDLRSFAPVPNRAID